MTEKQKIKKNPANLAKSYLADVSAVAIVAIYSGLQEVFEALPDLPNWAKGVLVLFAVLRALALAFLADRDGDGVPDYQLTFEQVQKALADGKLDADKVREELDKKAENVVTQP